VYQYTLSQDASGSPRYIIKKLSILSSVGIAGLSILLSPILLPIVFPEFVEAIQIIQIVSVGAVPHAINLSYISKFLGQEKSRIVLLGQVITLSIYLSGLFILGHFFGINGVAASLVFAGIAQSIFYFIADRFLIESKFFKKSNQYF